jgi:hypothetical protein
VFWFVFVCCVDTECFVLCLYVVFIQSVLVCVCMLCSYRVFWYTFNASNAVQNKLLPLGCEELINEFLHGSPPLKWRHVFFYFTGVS